MVFNEQPVGDQPGKEPQAMSKEDEMAQLSLDSSRSIRKWAESLSEEEIEKEFGPEENPMYDPGNILRDPDFCGFMAGDFLFSHQYRLLFRQEKENDQGSSSIQREAHQENNVVYKETIEFLQSVYFGEPIVEAAKKNRMGFSLYLREGRNRATTIFAKHAKLTIVSESGDWETIEDPDIIEARVGPNRRKMLAILHGGQTVASSLRLTYESALKRGFNESKARESFEMTLPQAEEMDKKKQELVEKNKDLDSASPVSAGPSRGLDGSAE